ncbi:swi5-dependent recombination DNA repair protein 1 homolog [Sorex fumeus]|uniref:swi5-dependent recombination DNA repair protein 1 homolog n=1 Tax=Sorex fumeus TaxID=62283 RepID=UPI0024AC97CC|nr:swi5-dependent recombination DNA repair protein 1 homolog [Sorex fumeus]XP_055976945.1 swi5-dependent recombination DNA repair protein 1 homolog [Sorex fumeus]
MESPSASAVALPCNSPSCTSSQRVPGTLRERLQKTRSSFSSSHCVVKRLRVDDDEEESNLADRPASSTEESHSECERFEHVDSDFERSVLLESSSKNTTACESKSFDSGPCSDLQNDSANENLHKEGLNEEKTNLVKQIQEKEELLRRLKLVKMYRSKNDLSQLQLLIKKWRSCSQRLLYELQSALSEENKKLSLTQLIDHYGLDDKLLHYNRNEEEFIEV